ncbi:MAG: TetR family transcriptional regulator [Peptococcaceae bacterium]|nr:TetR family transcriptional regulator [Peptococcaceae bacterium]
MDNESSTREKILDAAMELISKEGFDGITVRKIAAMADVNIALINYYYGSKENLLNETLKTLVAILQKSFNVLTDENLSARERLKIFLMRYAIGLRKYPDLVHRVITQDTFGFATPYDFASFLQHMGINRVMDIMRELTGITDPSVQRMMSMQLLGAMAFPILARPLLYDDIKDEFLASGSYEEYIDFLLDRYFGSGQ